MRKLVVSILFLFLLWLFLSIFGLTVLINNSSDRLEVYVVDQKGRYELTGIGDILYIGFPNKEGHFLVYCNSKENPREIGYVTKMGINHEVIESCN